MTMRWQPFRPGDWLDRGSCYPCLVWDKADNMVWTPCDPWSLPPENDYSTWVCVPTRQFVDEQLTIGATDVVQTYR